MSAKAPEGRQSLAEPCRHGWAAVIIDSGTREIYCPQERKVVDYLDSKQEFKKL